MSYLCYSFQLTPHVQLKSKFKEDLNEKIGMYGKTGLYEALVNIDKLQKEVSLKKMYKFTCTLIALVKYKNL